MNGLLQFLKSSGDVGENGFLNFNMNFNLVEVGSPAVDHNLVVGLGSFDAGQDMFDLRREDIDAPDNQKIVGSAQKAVHANSGTATGTGFPYQIGDIPGSVADQRGTFAAEGGDDKFSLLPVGERLSGERINDFGIEHVFVDVEPFLAGTLG